VRAAVEAERRGRRLRSPEFKAKLEANLAEDRERYDPTAGMGAGEKVLANIGAGMASAWQGARQIIPGLKSPTDEEVREKRELDKHLAEKTQLGIGADWMPSAGSALQVAGEIAPTLVPGAAATKFPRVLAMMRAAPIRTGAIAGGAGAALMPTTEDESRAMNVALGGATGAALPMAVRGYQLGRRALSAPARAEDRLVRELGEEVTTIPQQVAARESQRAAGPSVASAIPESLAEATGSTRAATLEAQTAREAANPEWAAFRREQNVAREAAVRDATGEAGRIAERRAARDVVADPMRERALGEAGKNQWFHQNAQQVAQDIMQSDAAVNPAVRRVADLVLSSMDDRAQTAITPKGLYEVRKLLADKLHGPLQIGDELSAAVKGADRQTLQLIEAIDKSLDQASGGRWQKYLDTYGRASRPVEQARSAQLAREVFEREGVPELGGVPEVTATRLGQALRASEGSASRRFPLELSPRAREGLEAVQENIARSNEVQKARKLAGTAGGGSQTSMDMARDAATGVIGNRSQLMGTALRWLGRNANQDTQRELAALLQDPRAAVAAIQRAQAAREPLSEAQTALLQAISQTSGAGLPRALQAQGG
jgi:hypothetical protein